MKPPRSITALYPNVTKCSDAKAPVKVTITPKDAQRADPKNFEQCAMALAACREWSADHALIGLSYSYVIKGNHAVRFKTPESVRREITSFDRGSGFAPGNYHLAAIPKSQRRKPSGPRNPARKHHGPKRKIFHAETLGIRHAKQELP